MKKIRKILISAVCFSIIVFSTAMSGCSIYNTTKFDDQWILGKTSEEIEEKYGEFDYTTMFKPQNGCYYSTKCGYEIDTYAFIPDFGLSPTPTYYMIYFDAYGVAYKIEEEAIRDF